MTDPSPSELSPTEAKRGWRSFLCLLVLQTQNAFNDNFARFLLVPLIIWLGAQPGASSLNALQHVLAVLLVIPFIFFSPAAGWFADRVPKNRVIRWSAWLQLVVLGALMVALWNQWLMGAFLAFFLLSTQSAILSPAKMGILKELVGTSRLALASGLMEMSAILAILGGQIYAGFLFAGRVVETGDGWSAALFPIAVATGAGVVSLACAYSMQLTSAHGAPRLRANVLFSQKRELSMLFLELKLGKPALLVAYFWGFAGFLNLICITAAKVITGGSVETGATLSWMLVAASGGIAVGAGVTGYISRARIELGLVPLGALMMTLSMICAAFTDIGSVWFHVWLAVMGIGGSILVVPLTAHLQEESPDDKRGGVMAASNILNNLAGVAGVLLQFALEAAGVSLNWQIALLGITGLFVTRIVFQESGAELIRFFGRAILGRIYRVDVKGGENLPETGGALLLPNHIGYSDAFVLSLASPRPIRFLMDSGMAKKWWAKHFVKLFHTVPISSSRAKEAISLTASAVAEGGLVALYPEGQLTRTGMMNEVKGGYALIARRADRPVVPIYIDGLWGSIFSHADGKFVKKWPTQWSYDVRVEMGPALDAKAKPIEVQEELLRLGRACWQRRETDAIVARISEQSHEHLSPLWSELSASKKVSIVLNALQLAEVYPAQDGKSLALILSGKERDLVLGLALPEVSRLEVTCVENDSEIDERFDGVVADRFIDVDGCLSFILGTGAADFGYPCYISEERVVTLSMPDPPSTSAQIHQPGQKNGAVGKLLPGISLQRGEGSVTLGLPDGSVCQLAGRVDEGGFYFPS